MVTEIVEIIREKEKCQGFCQENIEKHKET